MKFETLVSLRHGLAFASLALFTTSAASPMGDFPNPGSPPAGPNDCPGCQLDVPHQMTMTLADSPNGNIVISASESTLTLMHGKCIIVEHPPTPETAATTACTTYTPCSIAGTAVLTYPNWPQHPAVVGNPKYSRGASSSGMPWVLVERGTLSSPTNPSESKPFEFIQECTGRSSEHRQGFGTDSEYDGVGNNLATLTIGPVRCTLCEGAE